MVYLYGDSIFIGMFFSILLVTMNDGELPQPQKPGLYLDDLPFEPSPDRVIPRYPNASIVWNILGFTC
jgi:hypothetical protein